MSPLSISVRRVLTQSLRNPALNVDQKIPALPYLPPVLTFRSRLRPINHYDYLHPLRYSSSSSSYNTKPILPDVWEFQTEPFGKLIVEAPFHVDVRPLDPLSSPNQDKIQVTIRNEEEQLLPGWMEGVDCQVDHDPKKHVLRILGDLTESGYALFPSLESLPIFLEVFIPIKYDVDIVTSHHGRVSIKGLECDSVDVATEAGMTNLASLKTRRLRISSSFGDINVGGNIYGDVDLFTAGAGSLNVHKIQGSLSASTEAGALWIKSAYLTRCSLSTTGGDVRVTNLTGEDNQITSLHGDLTLDSVDGCLEATTQTGNILATFSRIPTSASLVARVTSESGDIDVKVGPEVSANVFIAGEQIHVDEKLGDRVAEVVDNVVDNVVDDKRIKADENNDNINDNSDNRNDSNNDSSSLEWRDSDDLALRQVGVKVGMNESEAVIHAVSKMGKVSLTKKDWFGAFKFGS